VQFKPLKSPSGLMERRVTHGGVSLFTANLTKQSREMARSHLACGGPFLANGTPCARDSPLPGGGSGGIPADTILKLASAQIRKGVQRGEATLPGV